MSGHESMSAAMRRPYRGAGLRRAAWLVALLVVAGAQAQEETAKDEATPSAEESRQVDESEESFRARMELREQRLREQQRGTPTFSYSPSQDGKLANLPPESQEHIRAQLRDMVIESRTWKPGEDLSGYPYEPSPGAAKDPGLAQQEREAFIEQLEKYQQREAAHAAAPSGSPGESGEPGEPAEGEGSAARGSTAVATAGVTESALDFLKQQGMAGKNAAETAEDGAGEGEAGEQEAAAEGAASPQADETGEGSAKEQQEAAAAGTVAIAELASLDPVLAGGASAGESAQQNQDQDQNQSKNQGESETGITMREVPETEPEPGTVDVEALQRLDPALVGARNADEDGQ